MKILRKYWPGSWRRRNREEFPPFFHFFQMVAGENNRLDTGLGSLVLIIWEKLNFSVVSHLNCLIDDLSCQVVKVLVSWP